MGTKKIKHTCSAYKENGCVLCRATYDNAVASYKADVRKFLRMLKTRPLGSKK